MAPHTAKPSRRSSWTGTQPCSTSTSKGNRLKLNAPHSKITNTISLTVRSHTNFTALPLSELPALLFPGLTYLLSSNRSLAYISSCSISIYIYINLFFIALSSRHLSLKFGGSFPRGQALVDCAPSVPAHCRSFARNVFCPSLWVCGAGCRLWGASPALPLLWSLSRQCLGRCLDPVSVGGRLADGAFMTCSSGAVAGTAVCLWFASLDLGSVTGSFHSCALCPGCPPSIV